MNQNGIGGALAVLNGRECTDFAQVGERKKEVKTGATTVEPRRVGTSSEKKKRERDTDRRKKRWNRDRGESHPKTKYEKKSEYRN